MNGGASHRNASIPELLNRAKSSIESGVASWRAATEDMAAAQEQGASQRQIAEAVGMSTAWVNHMLGWRRGGYQDESPFGPQSRASRERARVQAAERRKKTEKPDIGRDPAPAAASARAKTAKAEAAKAKADAEKATAEARRAQAEALKAQAEAARAEAEARSARARANNPNKQKVHSGPRELLVKALGMLGSEHVGERAAAALIVEKHRVKLGMCWDELIVPALEARARAA
jgi:type IV secretory pathway VirB10-like protein